MSSRQQEKLVGARKRKPGFISKEEKEDLRTESKSKLKLILSELKKMKKMSQPIHYVKPLTPPTVTPTFLPPPTSLPFSLPHPHPVSLQTEPLDLSMDAVDLSKRNHTPFTPPPTDHMMQFYQQYFLNQTSTRDNMTSTDPNEVAMGEGCRSEKSVAKEKKIFMALPRMRKLIGEGQVEVFGSPDSQQKQPTQQKKKPKQRRYRTERPFACPHCPAQFTLRSNMERHGKHQHPTVWQRSPSNRVLNKQKLLSCQPKSPSTSDSSQDLSVRAKLKRKLSENSENNEQLASVDKLLRLVQGQGEGGFFKREEREEGGQEEEDRDREEGEEREEEFGEKKLFKKQSAYSSAPHKGYEMLLILGSTLMTMVIQNEGCTESIHSRHMWAWSIIVSCGIDHYLIGWKVVLKTQKRRLECNVLVCCASFFGMWSSRYFLKPEFPDVFPPVDSLYNEYFVLYVLFYLFGFSFFRALINSVLLVWIFLNEPFPPLQLNEALWHEIFLTLGSTLIMVFLQDKGSIEPTDMMVHRPILTWKMWALFIVALFFWIEYLFIEWKVVRNIQVRRIQLNILLCCATGLLCASCLFLMPNAHDLKSVISAVRTTDAADSWESLVFMMFYLSTFSFFRALVNIILLSWTFVETLGWNELATNLQLPPGPRSDPSPGTLVGNESAANLQLPPGPRSESLITSISVTEAGLNLGWLTRTMKRTVTETRRLAD